jgi:4,5-dihydroxyphthalate decarboxylase
MTRLTRRQFCQTTAAIAGASLAEGSITDAAQGETATITLACANYARFMPLATGEVRAEGLSLKWRRGDRNEMLQKVTSDPTVDGGESSMARHIIRLDSGDRSLVAIPVFVLRNFTARDIYTKPGTALTPKTLNGRRLGIYNWAASGATWYRHLVRYFGQDPAKIQWIVGSPDQTTPVNPAAPLPANVSLAPAGRSLSDLLLEGKIDAFFAPLPPRRYHAVTGPITRLIPDFRPVEQGYFKATGCYPPQHVVLLRRAVWEKDPSIGRRLLDLFERCETQFHDGQRLYPYGTPWQLAEIEETERVLGREFHRHGIEANRRALDTFCQGAFDDGLTKRRVTVEEFFAEFLKA